ATEGLALVATATVGVLFQPVRQRVQGAANRLVYGARATPYRVLGDFAERMGETYAIEDVLPRMAELLGKGIGAIRVEVWLREGRELRLGAAWPGTTEGRAD